MTHLPLLYHRFTTSCIKMALTNIQKMNKLRTIVPPSHQHLSGDSIPFWRHPDLLLSSFQVRYQNLWEPLDERKQDNSSPYIKRTLSTSCSVPLPSGTLTSREPQIPPSCVWTGNSGSHHQGEAGKTNWRTEKTSSMATLLAHPYAMFSLISLRKDTRIGRYSLQSLIDFLSLTVPIIASKGGQTWCQKMSGPRSCLEARSWF